MFDVLMDIYVEYGFKLNKTINVVKPGKSGADEIKAMMDNFRANPPREIAGSPVVKVKDFKTLKETDGNGNSTELQMPEPSNVLQWFTADGTKVSVRPSGTEPKIMPTMTPRIINASVSGVAIAAMPSIKRSNM